MTNVPLCVWDIDNGGGYAYVGGGDVWEISSFSFAVNLKLLYK